MRGRSKIVRNLWYQKLRIVLIVGSSCAGINFIFTFGTETDPISETYCCSFNTGRWAESITLFQIVQTVVMVTSEKLMLVYVLVNVTVV